MVLKLSWLLNSLKLCFVAKYGEHYDVVTVSELSPGLSLSKWIGGSWADVASANLFQIRFFRFYYPVLLEPGQEKHVFFGKTFCFLSKRWGLEYRFGSVSNLFLQRGNFDSSEMTVPLPAVDSLPIHEYSGTWKCRDKGWFYLIRHT